MYEADCNRVTSKLCHTILLVWRSSKQINHSVHGTFAWDLEACFDGWHVPLDSWCVYVFE
jgi:hypothetical protein